MSEQLPPGYEVVAPDVSASLPEGYEVVNDAAPTPAPTPAPKPRPNIIPLSRDESGNLQWTMPQIAQDVIDAIMLPGDAYQGKVDPLSQEGIGRAFNAATVLANPTVGTASGKLLTETGEAVPRAVTRALSNDKVPLSEVGQRVSDLGGSGTVADLGMNVRDKAAAIATAPGPGQGVIVDALIARKAAAPERLTGALDDTLGPAPVPSYLHNEIDANKRVVGQQYDEPLTNAPPVDTAAIAAGIDDKVPVVRGAAQSQLQTARNMLNQTGTDALDPNAETLLQTRHALDGVLRETKDSNVMRVLQPVRQQVDAELAAKVPGIKDIDAQYSELSRQGEAVDQGQTVLGSGRTDLRPSELNDAVMRGAQPTGTMTGPSAVPLRLKQGARAEIDRIVGTNANDRAALNSLLKGDSDWNYQRLSTLFGKDKTDQLYSILSNEKAMAETENKALAGSKTASLTAARNETNGPPKGPGVIRSAANLRFGDAAVSLADKVTGGLASRSRDARNANIAKTLMSNGDWRDPGAAAPIPMGVILDAVLNRIGQVNQQPVANGNDQEMLDAIRRGLL